MRCRATRRSWQASKTLLANCLAHGRRQVVEVAENFPEECRYVLETLGDVYHHDALTRERELSPEDRLRFHQEHSGPLMKGLHEWMEAQLAEHKTEPNSGLGKAISYLLNHWPKLTLFLRQAGRANRQQHRRTCSEESHSESQERTLLQDAERRRSRRSVHESDPHLRTERGQSVRLSDRVAAAARNCRSNPSEWMPWNYRETLARLATPAAA